MTSIMEGKKTVRSDRDLVVPLIGARVNKWWLMRSRNSRPDGPVFEWRLGIPWIVELDEG